MQIDDLFQTHPTNTFQAIDDKELVNKNHVLLHAVYTFNLNVDSQKYPFFRADDPISEATIFKLDNQYYLCAIYNSDGYRSERGSIYQINFDEPALLNFLEQNQVQNLMPCAINVFIHTNNNHHHEGLLMKIKDYKSSEQKKYLLALMTYNINDYYPSGTINFNIPYLLKAIPIIEKQHLEQEVVLSTPSPTKLKI